MVGQSSSRTVEMVDEAWGRTWELKGGSEGSAGNCQDETDRSKERSDCRLVRTAVVLGLQGL